MSIETQSLRSDFSTTRVIKGGWQLAGGHGGFDRNQAVDDMMQFFDAGILSFDCADIYTGVEEMIGDFICNLRASRGSEEADKINIHTKLVPDLARLHEFTARDVEDIIDRSLKRLQVERLDLVQFFWWDMTQGKPVEVMQSLKTLQQKGKIRHLGVTNWDVDHIGPFIDGGLDIVSAQIQYSMLDARPAGRFANWCADHNIQMLCYGVLAGGFLTDDWVGKSEPGFEFENRSLIKYRLIIEEFGGWELFQELLTCLARIGQRYTVPLSAVAIRHLLDQPHVAAAIIGAKTARNLPETMTVFRFVLSDQDHLEIDAVLKGRQGPSGPVYALEGDRSGPHGRIMKYNINTADSQADTAENV